MFLEAGGGAARRAQPAAAGFACGFALRAKSGAAVAGRWQRAAAGRGRPAGRAAKPHTAPAGVGGRAPPRRGGGPAGRIAVGRSGPPAKNKTRKTAVLRAWFGAYR